LVGVGVSVCVGVGVKVGPNNCPGPQPDIPMLTANKRVVKKHMAGSSCFGFMLPCAVTGAPDNY